MNFKLLLKQCFNNDKYRLKYLYYKSVEFYENIEFFRLRSKKIL